MVRAIESLFFQLLLAILVQEVVSVGDYYSNVQDANLTSCLTSVESLPLKVFEFKYDPVAGRRQLGFIPEEIESISPESVNLAAKMNFPNPVKGQRPISVENIKMVDKNALFMLNLGATKELIQRQHEAEELISRVDELNKQQTFKLEHLKTYLEIEAEQQLVERRREKEAQAAKDAAALELERVQAEELRKTLALQAEQNKREAAHREELALRRLELEDQTQRARDNELLRLQSASQEKLEAQRRETEQELKAMQLAAEENLAAIEAEAGLERVKAEATARARSERENEDVALRQLKARGEEERRRLRAGVDAAAVQLAAGIHALATQPRKLALLLGFLITLAAGLFLVREASILGRRLLERQLGRPALLRETSRRTWLGAVVGAVGRIVWPGAETAASRDQFKGVVLEQALMGRVTSLASAARNARRHGAPLRHLLLFGPAGCGKTLVAKRLARGCGLDYAMMSGGDVGPLGASAVSELHNMFAWARGSSRGLLLFVDEAEAFLGSRGRGGGGGRRGGGTA